VFFVSDNSTLWNSTVGGYMDDVVNDAFPIGPGINTLCTEELVDELFRRERFTNGFEFVADKKIKKLLSILVKHL